MGNQWGEIYLCVPQPKCWGDVSPHPLIIAAPGPGGRETICSHPADGSSTRGGSTSVRGRVRSPHTSGGRRWLSCRQPACPKQLCAAVRLGQLRHGTDRRTDGRIAVSLSVPLYGVGHNTVATLPCLYFIY